MTLIELMIAMTLGLLVTGAVLGMYLSTSRNFTQDEIYLSMQENARFALRVLSQDLSMADYWGQMITPDAITLYGVSSPGGSCAEAIDVYNPDTGLMFVNNHSGSPQVDLSACDASSYKTDHKTGTDVLIIKRVASFPTAFVDTRDLDGDGNTSETLGWDLSEVYPGNDSPVILEQGTKYLRTNGETGQIRNLSEDGSSTKSPITDGSRLGLADWEYIPSIYFINDHFDPDNVGSKPSPALCRLRLGTSGTDIDPLYGSSDTDPIPNSRCLAEGVEDMHIMWGLDTDTIPDGYANRYTSTPTLAEMEDVVTARIFLLMRSTTEDRNYTDTKTYALGDYTATISDDAGTAIDETKLYRRVYTTTVSLRNPANLNVINY